MTVKAFVSRASYHERELFGGRMGAGSLGGEPVMRAERVRSVRPSRRSRRPKGRSSAVRAVRPFEPVGMRDGAVCEGVWGRRTRSYRSGPVRENTIRPNFMSLVLKFP